jgi:hypothetical protein
MSQKKGVQTYCREMSSIHSNGICALYTFLQPSETCKPHVIRMTLFEEYTIRLSSWFSTLAVLHHEHTQVSCRIAYTHDLSVNLLLTKKIVSEVVLNIIRWNRVVRNNRDPFLVFGIAQVMT